MEENEGGVFSILQIMRSAESPGQGGGFCLGGTFLCRSQCQTDEYALGLWTRRTETGETGRTYGCVGQRPQVFSV